MTQSPPAGGTAEGGAASGTNMAQNKRVSMRYDFGRGTRAARNRFEARRDCPGRGLSRHLSTLHHDGDRPRGPGDGRGGMHATGGTNVTGQSPFGDSPYDNEPFSSF